MGKARQRYRIIVRHEFGPDAMGSPPRVFTFKMRPLDCPPTVCHGQVRGKSLQGHGTELAQEVATWIPGLQAASILPMLSQVKRRKSGSKLRQATLKQVPS